MMWPGQCIAFRMIMLLLNPEVATKLVSYAEALCLKRAG